MVASRAETSTLISWYAGAVECRFLIHLQACSRIATGTGVHRVRQRSDVDLVKKSACIESGRQHLGHVAEGRDCECRKGRVHQVSKRNVRYVNDAQTSSNRGTERCGRRRSNEVLHKTPSRVGTLEEDLHLCFRARSCLQPPRCQVPRTARQKLYEQSQPANQQQICLVQRSSRRSW